MASILSHLRPCSVLCLALAVTACGDDTTGTGSTTTGSTTTGPSTVADTSSTGPTSTPGSTGSTGSTSTADPTGSTGSSSGPDPSTSGSSGSSGSDSSGSESSTGNQGNVLYTALAVPGGLDRIRINKADLDNDRCTWVILVAPAIPGTFPGMTIPAGWSVESVSINDVAIACDSDNPGMFGGEAALDANGTIGFGMLGGTGIYPCTVDIDATFDFAGMLPGIPPTDDMIAVDVPVAGC